MRQTPPPFPNPPKPPWPTTASFLKIIGLDLLFGILCAAFLEGGSKIGGTAAEHASERFAIGAGFGIIPSIALVAIGEALWEKFGKK